MHIQGTPDVIPPGVALTGMVAGPPRQLQITCQDGQSGLAYIQVAEAVNCTVAIPAFMVGTNDPVLVVATKTNQSLGARVVLQVTDVAGNVTRADPVEITLSRDNGKPQSVTVSVPAEECNVTVMNGSPGVKNLRLEVNGQKFEVAGLSDGGTASLDLAAAMVAGENQVVVTALGAPGGSVTILFTE